MTSMSVRREDGMKVEEKGRVSACPGRGFRTQKKQTFSRLNFSQ
jgi:hypothetical protein